MLKRTGNILHDFFLIGIAIKGFDGLVELLSGIVLLFIKSDWISSFIQMLFRKELIQDPTDAIAIYFVHISHHIPTGTILFISLYLIIRGAIKIGLVLGLWYKKLWVYPVSAVVLLLLIFFQIVSFLNNHSVILAFLTVVDLVIIVLLKFEYRRIKKSLH